MSQPSGKFIVTRELTSEDVIRTLFGVTPSQLADKIVRGEIKLVSQVRDETPEIQNGR